MSFFSGIRSTKPPVPNLNDMMQQKIESYVDAFALGLNDTMDKPSANAST